MNHLAEKARNKVSVTTFAGVFYIVFTLVALALHGWNPLWFAWQGERFAELEIGGNTGYDGQFVLYIARDGWEAIPHLDNPPYRLQRVLTAVVARCLSLGIDALIPWAIVVVNAAAIVLTTAALAGWLQEQAVSPWYALTYTLFVGTLMAFSRDLTEPLALCLATIGATRWIRGNYRLAIVYWALAALAKETMLLFPIGAAAASIIRGQIRLGAGVGLAAVPLLGWEAYLYERLGVIPFLSGSSPEYLPLAGLIGPVNLDPGHLSAVILIALGAVILLPVSLAYLWRQRQTPIAAMWLLLHVVFALVFPSDVYAHIMHAGRNAGGMVVALTLLLPSLRRPVRLCALSFSIIPTLVWMVPILRWAPWLSAA